MQGVEGFGSFPWHGLGLHTRGWLSCSIPSAVKQTLAGLGVTPGSGGSDTARDTAGKGSQGQLVSANLLVPVSDIP